MKKTRDWFLAIAIVFLLARLIVGMGGEETVGHEGIVRVADGDSLTLNCESIRLWGIDAPELSQICRRNAETYFCGQVAKGQLKSLIGASRVSCKYLDKDKYGRWLAKCSAGGVDLNQAMVESGWAVAYGGYVTDELKARSQKKGLWEGTFDMPRAWRDGNRHTLEQETSPDWLGQSVAFISSGVSKFILWFRGEIE